MRIKYLLKAVCWAALAVMSFTRAHAQTQPAAPEANGVVTAEDVQKIIAMNTGSFLTVKMQDGSSHPFIDGTVVAQWATSKLTEARTAQAKLDAAAAAAKPKDQPAPAPEAPAHALPTPETK